MKRPAQYIRLRLVEWVYGLLTAPLRLFHDGCLDVFQSLGPDELWRFPWIIAGHVARQTGCGLCIFQLRIPKNFATNRRQSGIIFHE